MISEWIAAILLILGALFMLISAIGMLRLPDIYLRTHAATKAPSLGLLLMVTGLAVYFGEWWPAVEAFLISLFIFITLPIGTHMIALVAHIMKTPQSDKTALDELAPEDKEKAQ